MRLKSFRIKNFRSIVDSGWNNLAYDNITALIGQNESGKTTVLEALQSFSEGAVSENVLRSDMSMPEISCAFIYIQDIFTNNIDKSLVPEGFFDLFYNKGSFTLTRKWLDEKNTRIMLDDDELKEIYKHNDENKTQREQEIRKEIHNINNKLNDSLEELSQLNLERQNKEKSYNQARFEFEKLEASYKRNSNDEEIKNIYTKAKNDIEKQKAALDKILENCENKTKNISAISENSKYAKKCSDIESQKIKLEKELELALEEIKITSEQKEFASSRKKRRNFQRKLDTLNKIVTDKKLHVARLQNEYDFNALVFEKISGGTNSKVAEEEALNITQSGKSYLDLEELGEILARHMPEFEFFEDFSSLLPDRIDLEDIVNRNSNVEGYKAATNLLTIAGLTSDFFNLKNNRMLKQKIENLNGEINVDFHEYWQQKIGKENKIKINFELEHYGFQNPEKKGKPYLEFWIKDAKESLYPKQRSRGVRWFLSFYLELRAKALSNKDSNIILLIDEPGVSLHARAQEDVLKVFEDIKENVQIVYTTHSPHLININKLYRILAVQRAKEGDVYSETVVFDAESLNSASSDTLSPIYTLMGTRISEQQVIQKRNNVIVEDVATYYYLSYFFKLLNVTKEIYFLPATDVSSVPTLVNILIGWKLDFIVLLDDDKDGNNVYSGLKKQLFNNSDEEITKKIILLDKCKSIEDLFSTIDFKKHILNKRVGITEDNSAYIEENNLSRAVLASSFISHIEKDRVTFKDFDEETKNNIEWIVNTILNSMN